MTTEQKKTIFENGERHSFLNDERRSGRTSIIIAKGIFQLLTEGKTIVTDHYHEMMSEQSFYKSHIIPNFYVGLSGILNLEIEDTMIAFSNKSKFINGVLIGVEFTTNQFFNPYNGKK